VAGAVNPAAQTFSISNTGGGTLTWSLSENASWLSVSPTSGTTTTTPAQVTVSLNITGLLEGSYSAPITITAPGSTNGSQQVPVTLTLTPPPSTIGLNQANLSWTFAEGTTNSGSQTFNITNTGAGTLTWSAAEGASWLTLNATSGTTTTETDVITVTVNPAGLTPNVYTAPITITASGATNSPQQVLATLAVTARTSGKAILTWDPNTESDLTGYKVYVGTTSRSYGPPVDVGKVTTFEIINLQAGKTYYFAVTAYDNSGNESGYSNEANKSIP